MQNEIDSLVQSLEVRVPLRSYNGGLPAVVPITIDITMDPNDFLACIIANMDLNAKEANLGWRSCDDPKTSTPHLLRTADDVQHAFREMSGLLNNK